jgi:hypothetical protein
MTELKGTRQMYIDAYNDGEVEIETVGFKGDACKTETEFLKEALGETISETLKTVFFVKERSITPEQKIREGRAFKPFCG